MFQSYYLFCFFTEIGADEVMMGLNLIRWWYIRKATGKVLELACGTGRNFSYYSMKQCDSITAIDSVKDMVTISQNKILETKDMEKLSKIQIKQMSVTDIASKFQENTFDTVVDTFGLCSYDNPIQVLNDIAKILKKPHNALASRGNEDDKQRPFDAAHAYGKVIFIEHGQSHYQWLNNIIHNGAKEHARRWGCIWNLPIEDLVQQSNLKIVNISRFHFGTTYVIEAIPMTDEEIAHRQKTHPITVSAAERSHCAHEYHNTVHAPPSSTEKTKVHVKEEQIVPHHIPTPSSTDSNNPK